MKMQAYNMRAANKVKLSPLKNGPDDPIIILNGSRDSYQP
jgi:hypothetical protein